MPDNINRNAYILVLLIGMYNYILKHAEEGVIQTGFFGVYLVL